jgi:outer membrane protein assembly factor BamB
MFNRRRTRPVPLASWPLLKDATRTTARAFDEAAHRLFIGTRNSGKLIVLDSNTGKVLASLPAAGMVLFSKR